MNRLFSRSAGFWLAGFLLLAGRPTWGQVAGQAAASEQGTLIDRIVAVVEGVEDGRVITWSDLNFEASVAAVQQEGGQAALVQLDDQALRAALDLAIARRLLIAEADKVGAFQPNDGDLDAAVRAFEARFESPAAFQRFLRRHDVDRAAVREVLRRSMRAERVLEGRVRLRAQVSEGDVRRYYDVHQQELNGTYEEIRQALREKLLREKYAQLVRAEVAHLQKRADVKLVAPPAQAGEGGP